MGAGDEGRRAIMYPRMSEIGDRRVLRQSGDGDCCDNATRQIRETYCILDLACEAARKVASLEGSVSLIYMKIQIDPLSFEPTYLCHN